jgi:hypothetical protein
LTDSPEDTPRGAAFEQIRRALDAAGLPSADFGRFTSNRHPDVIRPSVFDDRGAVPVLLNLLPSVFHPDALEAIVRHLTTPFARPVAAAPLIALFRTTVPADSSLKWAIGNALSVVTSPVHRDDLLELALDPRHGRGRQMIVDRLGRISGDSRIIDGLRELGTDPDVALHAQASLRKRVGPAAAADYIRPLLTHPSESVRRGAEYNMRKLAKALKSSTG